MNTIKGPKKSRVTMSPHMFQLLRFAEENVITLDDLRRTRQNTLSALLKRDCVDRTGNKLEITRFGRIALEQYRHVGLPERGFERDLTDHVKSLLKLVRAKAARRAA
jgi:hypothetical protein